VTGPTEELVVSDRDLAAVRELHEAAIAARVYVAKASDPSYLGEHRDGQDKARDTLDRLDGAITEAGELLSGVTS
jgi:hypothetical protein